MKEITLGTGLVPSSFFERVRIHNRWAEVAGMDPYIRAAVNCKTQHNGMVASFDRNSFVHGYTMRVVPFEEQYALDCDNDVTGRTLGWLELEQLEEDERQVRRSLSLSLQIWSRFDTELIRI